jgi:hypothetical protein
MIAPFCHSQFPFEPSQSVHPRCLIAQGFCRLWTQIPILGGVDLAVRHHVGPFRLALDLDTQCASTWAN